MEKIQMSLNLKLAVIKSGKYQFEIALEAGISEVKFSKILKGRIEPNQNEKDKIAKVLGRPINELFPEDKNEKVR